MDLNHGCERHSCLQGLVEFETLIRWNFSLFPCLVADDDMKLVTHAAWTLRSVSTVLSLWWLLCNFNYMWRLWTSVNIWDAVYWRHSLKILSHCETGCSCGPVISYVYSVLQSTVLNTDPYVWCHLTLKTLHFAVTVGLCFVWWIATVSLGTINQLILIMLVLGVFGDVWTQLLTF
jgi:hypothetical protein